MDHGHGRQRAAEVLSEEPEADLPTRVIALVAEHAGRKPEVITREQRLAADLGMEGGSAMALMRAFEHRFDVDFDGFVFLRHFSEEGWRPFRRLIVLVLQQASPAFARRWQAAKNAERDIVVAHLIDVAAAKRWSEPDRRPSNDKTGPVTAFMRRAFDLLAPLTLALVPGVYLAASLGTSGRSALAMLSGGVAFTLVLGFFFWSAWKSIQRKLASAPG